MKFLLTPFQSAAHVISSFVARLARVVSLFLGEVMDKVAKLATFSFL